MTKASVRAPGQVRPERPPGAQTATALPIIAAVVAGLYFGREVFVPLALAILLTFLLALPVRWLRRLHAGRVPAVIIVVALAFVTIFVFSAVIAQQVTDLAASLPQYQRNIEMKIRNFRDSPPGGSIFERAAGVLQNLREEIGRPDRSGDRGTPSGRVGETTGEQAPVPVEIREPDPPPLELLQSVIGPLIEPLATGGIVIVFVMFMLLQREDLRDRLIRLAGPRDLQRTTEALDEAGKRVARYLLMQLVVNVTYGVPVSIGLWLIGVPNPLLWGMLAVVLRFVPYIGPIIAATFPLLLSLAVDPGWSMLLWTALLFIGLELVSNNVLEPWLYGSSTGMSPIAVIVAAVFWTWLWGPIGLLLSTPLTVCLVVLGQHVPQLAFLDVMLGNEPVLRPSETLYQRLLMGDPDEATERAEEFLAERPLAEFYDEVAIPALALAEYDRTRGVLGDERRARVAESAMILVENLAEHEDGGGDGVSPEAAAEEDGRTDGEPAQAAPDRRTVLCIAGRGNLDEAAAAMLAQLLEREGLVARVVPFTEARPMALPRLDIDGVAMACLSYMNPDSLAHARYLARRLKRRMPGVPVLVGFWNLPAEAMSGDPVAATRADLFATSLSQATAMVTATLASDPPADVPAESAAD